MTEKAINPAVAEENVLDILLGLQTEVPTKQFKMTRLSKEAGRDVVFEVKALSYNQVAEFIEGKDDSEFFIVMEGLMSPNIRDARLLQKYGALTPVELLKNNKFLLPGEVKELSLLIEQLSGYRTSSFKALRKN